MVTNGQDFDYFYSLYNMDLSLSSYFFDKDINLCSSKQGRLEGVVRTEANREVKEEDERLKTIRLELEEMKKKEKREVQLRGL